MTALILDTQEMYRRQSFQMEISLINYNYTMVTAGRGVLDILCAPSPCLLFQPSLCVTRISGRSCMHNLSVPKNWSQGATLVSEGWERIQMLPSSLGQLVSPQDFYLFVNKYQKRPELLLAVDKLSAPSRLTLFTPVPWDYFSKVKLPANKPTSRKPTSQALLSRRNPGARDKK